MKEIELSKDVIKVLRPALSGAVGTIKREIKEGVSNLYISANQSLYIVLRPEGDQLVVVAVAGKHLIKTQKEIISFAVNHGFTSIRFHTKNPKILRAGLAGLSVRLIEVRKNLFGKNELIYVINLERVNYGR